MMQEFKNSSTLVKVLVVAIALLILVALGCGCILLARMLFFAPDTPSTPAPPISFVTPTPGGEATPVPPVEVTGWKGEYFSNPDLEGEPTVVRDDEQINFDWGNGSPAPEIPADNFSARWTRTVEDVPAGTYRLNGRFDNRVRIWIDDVLVVDQWRESGVRTVNVDVNVAAGLHNLRVEYGHLAGQSVAQLSATHIQQYPDWQAEYFNNPALADAPAVVRNEVEINYNWGATSPIPGVIQDNDYSVRWNRTAHFEAGSYLLRVLVEGGARVWVNGQIVIDTWEQGAFREATAPIGPLDRGNHAIKVEYWKQSGNGQISVSWAEQQEPDEPPLAVIDGTTRAQVGQQANYSARNSSVAEGSHLTTFNWEFGDGATAGGVNVSHAYNAAGSYDVKLTVVDDKGRSDTTTHRTEITEAPVEGPVAVINAPSKAEVDDVITFDGSRSTCTEACVRYDWDLGDGSKANAIKLQHSYRSPGIYNVTLTITDNKNQTNSTVKSIEIRPVSPGPTPTPTNTPVPEPGNPVAVINAPADATVGQPVTLDGSQSADSSGARCVDSGNCDFTWNLGDGSTDNRITIPDKVYNAGGQYSISLSVTDRTTGKNGTTGHTISVNVPQPTGEPPTETPVPTSEPPTETPVPTTEPPPDPPQAVIEFDPPNPAVGDKVTFSCLNSVPGGDKPEITKCAWDFGDGGTSSEKTPSYAYNAEGTYTVTLTATNSKGLTDTATATITVTGASQLPVETPTPNP